MIRLLTKPSVFLRRFSLKPTLTISRRLACGPPPKWSGAKKKIGERGLRGRPFSASGHARLASVADFAPLLLAARSQASKSLWV